MNKEVLNKYKEEGFLVTVMHLGQKRPYGDTYYEFLVVSDKPESEVKNFCTEKLHPCNLTSAQYLKDEREGVSDFSDHFRNHYALKAKKPGEYLYVVTSPSTH